MSRTEGGSTTTLGSTSVVSVGHRWWPTWQGVLSKSIHETDTRVHDGDCPTFRTLARSWAAARAQTLRRITSSCIPKALWESGTTGSRLPLAVASHSR